MLALKDKVILIADADTQVGEAAVKTFVQYGSFVVITGRNAAKLKDISRKHGTDRNMVEVVQSDLTKQTSSQQLIETIKQKFGVLHILLFCSPSVPYRDTETVTRDELANAWRHQVVGPMTLLKEALPHLQASKGSVVVLTSLGARKTDGTLTVTDVYREYFTRLIAQEERLKGVKLNTINCYCCETPGTLLDRIYRRMFWSVLPQPNSMPADVAQHVAFIVSGCAEHITGNGFHLDGGLSMTCYVANSLITRLITFSSYYMKIFNDYFSRKVG
jgi:meso-butanediol dehydrogenase/(S,S)-butanediol dehydrogenase/diacetyl reductase